ncbi:MAG: hypothetical protein GY792_03750 [Gammaproteobacteria bacterium]|nr:hypothetical protein [Gammaproteobacteria bacterium]
MSQEPGRTAKLLDHTIPGLGESGDYNLLVDTGGSRCDRYRSEITDVTDKVSTDKGQPKEVEKEWQ